MKPIDHAILAEGAIPLSTPLIVHVVRQFLPNRGGLEDVVYNLARQSLKSGYRVRVVTLNSLFSNRNVKLAAHETIDGIEVVRIGWSGSSRYPLAPTVLSHIGDADMVHVHAIDFFFDFLAMTRLLHRKPMIVTTHGGFFHTQRFAALKKVWFQTLTRLSASRYDSVVCCSQSDLEMFQGIAPSRAVLIDNGTDTDKFAGAASRDPQKRIVTIGRFAVNKRLERLLDSLTELRRRDPQWQLDIIGVPGDLSVDDLETMISERSLSGNAVLRVNLSNGEIREHLRRASIFASASEYEGFGLVAIETMSAGLVPVLENNSAYRALAGRHRDISLSDFSRPAVAASSIQEAFDALVHDPSLRDRMMKAASAYSWSKASARYMKLYQHHVEVYATA